MRKKKEIPISTFFKEQMKINSKSIDLQNKGITVIDEISPFLSSEIETLNLKNNKLTSLKGIEQLSFLKELDISTNKIVSCRELQRVKALPNLKKIFFSNNPFLSEPIDQDLLDVILQKQTDLDLLSFELIKEVENEEIKIIFLKNYLSKIKLHQQLKANQMVAENNNKLKTDELVDKIVPQFYSIIENPKLANSIKRQALDIKKKSNQTFQGALAVTKTLKQKTIDQLIANIVQILHQTSSFTNERNFTLEVNLNNSTISFSPERSKGFKNSMRIEEQAQFSPVKYIDFSKDDNTLEDIGLPSIKAYFSKGKQGISKIPEKVIAQQRQRSQDNQDTVRKNKIQYFKQNPSNKIEEQLRGAHQKKVKIERNMEAKELAERQRERQRQMKETKSNFLKPASQPIKNTENYIKVVQSHIGDREENPIRISKTSSNLVFSKSETMRTPNQGQQSTISWKNVIHSADQLTIENLEIIYFKNLLRIHPMFNLLHSPVQSLKNEQKDTILQALKVSHKQNFIQLLKEKIMNQSLNRQIEELRMIAEQRIEETKLLNKDTYQENVRLKEEFGWVDSRNKTLQQDYSKLYARFKELQASQKNKTLAIGVMETSYKKIKETYIQKTQELQKFLSEDQKEEIIIKKRQQRSRLIYFNLLLKKAEIWKTIFSKSIKKQQTFNEELKILGFQAFRTNFILNNSIKHYIKTKNYLIMKQNFSNWLLCNSLERRQAKLKNKKSSFQMKEFVQLLRKNQALTKMKKLKNIWALRFYKQQKYKKSLKMWQVQFKQSQQRWRKAQEHQTLLSLNAYFNAIKQLMQQRKSSIQKIYFRHSNRKFKQQFKKLIYLMGKDVIVNSQKDNQVRLFYERSCRIKNYHHFKNYTKDLKSFRTKVIKAKIQLLRKHWNSFRRSFKLKLKRMGKFSNYCRFLSRQIMKKTLNREKASFDYSDRLLRKQKKTFVQFLQQNRRKEQAIRDSWLKIVKQKQNKLVLLKLRFLKKLQIARLYGRDFVKHRLIEEMGVQMNMNDNQTLEIIHQEQSIIQKCEQQIIFLKKQIQMQSGRQMMLLTEKDELMLSVNESYEIIVELRKQIELLKQQHKIKDEQYKSIVRKYNQIVKALQNHGRMPSPINGAKPD